MAKTHFSLSSLLYLIAFDIIRLMSTIEYQPLPPIERELLGKTWEELRVVAQKYYQQYEQLINDRDIEDLPREEQAQVETLTQRIESIIWQEDIAHAKKIMETPSSTPEEVRFARHVIWNYQVNQLIEGAIPADPRARAKVIKMNGKIMDPPKFVSLKEQIAYHWSASRWDIERIADEILATHPDPDGKIWKWRELQLVDGID